MSPTIHVAGWQAVAVVALVLIFAPVIWSKYPKAPGPLVARFTKLWQVYRMAQGNFHKEIIEMHKTHGELLLRIVKSFQYTNVSAQRLMANLRQYCPPRSGLLQH